MRRILFAVGFAVLGTVGFAILYVGNRAVPYSLHHFKQIHAIQLASMIKAWQAAGGGEGGIGGLATTNSSLRVFAFRTNIIAGGQTYTTFVALEADNFRRKGVLIGATNSDVLWLDSTGHANTEYIGSKGNTFPK